MGTRHDADGTGTGANTSPVAGRGARADERTSRTKRSRRTVLTIGLGVVATLVSALAAVVASASARATYYLPPRDGSTEATEHHDWLESVLALIPVSLVAGLLALVATVLGIGALVRRREAALWQLVLAGLALVIALAVLFTVPILLDGTGTY